MATATAVKSFEESADHRLLEGVMTREVADVEAAIAAGADVNRRNEVCAPRQRASTLIRYHIEWMFDLIFCCDADGYDATLNGGEHGTT